MFVCEVCVLGDDCAAIWCLGKRMVDGFSCSRVSTVCVEMGKFVGLLYFAACEISTKWCVIGITRYQKPYKLTNSYKVNNRPFIFRKEFNKNTKEK